LIGNASKGACLGPVPFWPIGNDAKDRNANCLSFSRDARGSPASQKMKIVIAKTSGFCMGVRRAVEMVLDAPEKHQGPISTYGPLIHNPQVLELLAQKGIASLEEIPTRGDGTVLIRAHGVPPQTKRALKEAGFKVLDATCPRVIKVQSIIRKHAKRGAATIIIGDKNHPEVMGLRGCAGDQGYVAADLAELQALPEFAQAIIVAQTTQNTRLFETVKQWTASHRPHYRIFNTICDSTERRQAEVKRLAESVDAVIVVGGRSSGNTRRLYEIARHTGKPAFHIENETELESLDLTPLMNAENIGITAGASTPNWIIKKVYRSLENLLFKRRRGWHRALYSAMRAALLTNLYVSLGAGCLCYACIKMLAIPRYAPYVFIAFLYVQSMHILNHLTGNRADRYNDPDRANFYHDHRRLLTCLAIAAGAAGLVLAYSQGLFPFIALLVMSMMGLSYNIRLVPRQFTRLVYRRIRDIPGSKTLLIAMAWGVVTAVLPTLAVTGTLTWSAALIFGWAAGLVFVRTALFDILDMQGDRLVGKDTIPILLGEKDSLRLLKTMLVLLAAIPGLSSLLGLAGPLGYLLILCPVFFYILLAAYEKGAMLPGTRLEFLVESQFVLAGALALVGA